MLIAVDRIEKDNVNGLGLRAIMSLPPRDKGELDAVSFVRANGDAVIKAARRLDAERKVGHMRSPLHGVPVIVK